MTAGRVLVLGARSWVGFRLIEAIKRLDPKAAVIGTSRNVRHEGPFIAADQSPDFDAVVRRVMPTAVINLLRGEDDRGRAIHSKVASLCAGLGVHYAFASSALALDGYTGVELTEDLEPRSVTTYGRFKASCEQDLKRIGGDWLVLRFASIHGWSPWKQSRTETFLARLARGEPVSVDRGVSQNRLEDRVFADAVAQAVLDRRTGILHLGTTDSSEELDFLRRLAQAFGQPAALVVPGGERQVNLVVRPRRLFEYYPGRFARTEAQTIDGLLACKELQRYRVSEVASWQ
jgi:dTDP-4-dehydrorhamnose reductase